MQDLGQGVVLVLALEELETLGSARAALPDDL